MSRIMDDGTIVLRKGDTETLNISARADYNDYEFSVGDILTFTARESPSSDIAISVSKTVTVAGTVQTIVIPAATMSTIDAGKYSCDIQLNSDGTIKTIFPVTDLDNLRYSENKNWKNLIVEAEVTANG